MQNIGKNIWSQQKFAYKRVLHIIGLHISGFYCISPYRHGIFRESATSPPRMPGGRLVVGHLVGRFLDAILALPIKLPTMPRGASSTFVSPFLLSTFVTFPVCGVKCLQFPYLLPRNAEKNFSVEEERGDDVRRRESEIKRQLDESVDEDRLSHH